MDISVTVQIISLVMLAYFLGSISFAKLITGLKGIDLRQVGSGNLGATNVYRACGLKVAVVVFFLDALKAAIPTAIAIMILTNPWAHIGVGAMTVVGHSLSVFVSFKGGKGVAPSLGVLFAIAPVITLIVFVVGVSLISIFRYVAPVSIVGSIAFPVLLYCYDYPLPYVIVVSLLALFIIVRHRTNIHRLLKGQENRI